ncbi:MAG: hypothetical protein ACRDRQ_21850 [Pseudonocardiaceae bacterium]
MVQGYVVASGVDVPAGAAVVDVPLSLLPELADAAPRDGLVLTDSGMIRIRGLQVTDPEVLNELNMPEGENAIALPLSALRELEVTTHA